MNRRSFFSTISRAVVGFTILPGAGRVWKAIHEVQPVSFYDMMLNPSEMFSEPLDFDKLKSNLFKIRERLHYPETIGIWVSSDDILTLIELGYVKERDPVEYMNEILGRF